MTINDNINLFEVNSSIINSIGYILKNKELIIKMNNSNILYIYDHVPVDVYGNFLVSESKGKFFIKEIRNKYDFRKILQ